MKCNMKQFVFILFSFLMVTGLATAQKKAVISADTTSYDFGRITEKGGKITHTFTIENKGDAPLVVTNVIASCGCTTPEWTKAPIASGKKGDIKVTYNPAGRGTGPFSKSISVYSNGKEGSFVFTIKGIVNETEKEE